MSNNLNCHVGNQKNGTPIGDFPVMLCRSASPGEILPMGNTYNNKCMEIPSPDDIVNSKHQCSARGNQSEPKKHLKTSLKECLKKYLKKPKMVPAKTLGKCLKKHLQKPKKLEKYLKKVPEENT